MHAMSHTMLRSLDDGQVGFSESSLAEWVVPETLTFALYVNNFKSVTMGSLRWCALGFARSACLISDGDGGVTGFVFGGRGC